MLLKQDVRQRKKKTNKKYIFKKKNWKLISEDCFSQSVSDAVNVETVLQIREKKSNLQLGTLLS